VKVSDEAIVASNTYHMRMDGDIYFLAPVVINLIKIITLSRNKLSSRIG
jgi:hypothetical protein